MERVFVARARNWDLGESSTGKEQIAIQFEVLTPDAGMRHITWYGYFTDTTMERTIQSMRYCGWQGSDLTDLSGMDANEVEIVVDDEVYEGKTRTKVKWINRGGGLALKAPMDANKRKAFAASMRANIRAIDAGATPNGKPAPRQSPRASSTPPDPMGLLNNPPPMSDDDIPF